MSERELKPGSFYWIRPTFDVDFDPPGYEGKEWTDDPRRFEASWSHWSQNDQPARFDGYDATGQEKWIFLGQDEDPDHHWSVCWVGEEIIAAHKAPATSQSLASDNPV